MAPVIRHSGGDNEPHCPRVRAHIGLREEDASEEPCFLSSDGKKENTVGVIRHKQMLRVERPPRFFARLHRIAIVLFCLFLSLIRGALREGASPPKYSHLYL